MGMRTTILTLNKLGKVQLVSILKQNLKKYIPVSVTQEGKNIFVTPKKLSTLLPEKALRGNKKPRHRRQSGIRAITDRLFEQFRFPLYRRNLVDEQDILRLMKRLRVQYNSVHNETKLTTQRLVVEVGAAERLIIQQKTSGREVEYTQSVGTAYYEKNNQGTEDMFADLQQSLLKFILQEDYSDLTQLQVEKRYAAIAFFVIFEQDRR